MLRIAFQAVAFAFVCAAALAQTADRPPNIIFILADDLGYGDVGAYGQRQIQTPRLDQMAREGMLFTQAYAGSTVCAPSRSSLMTGQHTGHTRVRGNVLLPLLPHDVTVAEVLQDAGYRTALIGKWGLGEPDTTGIPTRQGFDYFFGYLNQKHAHTYYPEYLWRNEEKVPLKNVEVRENVAVERVEYSHDLFTDEAVNFISASADQAEPRPFFLYLAYTIPHANNERGRDGMEVPDYGQYADKNWPGPQKAHAAMITRMDRDVGRLLDTVRERDLAESTIVIFTSDNGPHREGGADPEFFDSNGPLRGIKRGLTEGGIRVPAIAWGPGHVPAGATSDFVWAFWDFLPTAADLAGANAPDDVDGISIAPVLLGETPPSPHEHLYWEFHEGGFHQAVRAGNWKGIWNHRTNEKMLFNLAEDMDESRDLAAEQPEKMSQLAQLMLQLHEPSEAFPAPID